MTCGVVFCCSRVFPLPFPLRLPVVLSFPLHNFFFLSLLSLFLSLSLSIFFLPQPSPPSPPVCLPFYVCLSSVLLLAGSALQLQTPRERRYLYEVYFFFYVWNRIFPPNGEVNPLDSLLP